MDFSGFSGQQSQPYSLYGLPTPDHKGPQKSDETLRDPFALVCRPWPLHGPAILDLPRMTLTSLPE